MKRLAERVPPGPKMAFLLACLVAALYLNNLAVLAALNAAMVIVCIVFSDTFRDIMVVVRRIALGFPFLMLIFILSEYGALNDWTAAIQKGLEGSLIFILKIHFVIWTNLFLVYTTESREIVRALRKLRTPRELCVMMVIILRFFPVMFDEAMAVYQAQKARGFEFRRMLNLSNWLPLAVPLVVSVMKKSHDLAITLELKGMFDETPADSSVVS